MAKSTLKLVGVYDAWSPRARQARLTRSNGAEVPVLVRISDDAAADGDTMARLREEARLIGRLQHENVLRLENVSAVTGRVAHVYEGVDAASAARITQVLRIRNQSWPARAAVEVVAAVGLVLEEALRIEDGPRRLAHLGPSPEDVLIDVTGRVKLAGITVIGVEAPASPRGYAPPEGIGSLPAATYMLGALLVELLTGETPPDAGATSEAHDASIRRGLMRVIGRPTDAVGDPVVVALRQALAFDPMTRGTPGTMARRLRELAVSLTSSGLRAWAPGFVPAAQKAPTAWPSTPQAAPPPPARPAEPLRAVPDPGASRILTADASRASRMGGATIVPMEDGSDDARYAAEILAAVNRGGALPDNQRANLPDLANEDDVGDQTVAIPTRAPLARPTAPADELAAPVRTTPNEPRLGAGPRIEPRSPIPVSVGPREPGAPAGRIEPLTRAPAAGLRAEPSMPTSVPVAEEHTDGDATVVAGLRPMPPPPAPPRGGWQSGVSLDPTPARPHVSMEISGNAPAKAENDDPFEDAPAAPPRSRTLFLVAGGALALGLALVVVLVVAAVFLNQEPETAVPIEPPSTTAVAPAEPTPAEPTEPTPAEPTPAEPTPAEPTPAEPTPAEPAAAPAPAATPAAPTPTPAATPPAATPPATATPAPTPTRTPPASAPAEDPATARITPKEEPRITPPAPAPVAAAPEPAPAAAAATPAAATPPAPAWFRVEFRSGDAGITSLEVKCVNKSGSGAVVVLEEVGRGPCRVTGRGGETPLITSAIVTADRKFECFAGGARSCQ